MLVVRLSILMKDLVNGTHIVVRIIHTVVRIDVTINCVDVRKITGWRYIGRETRHVTWRRVLGDVAGGRCRCRVLSITLLVDFY